jgi:hypothetical protein
MTRIKIVLDHVESKAKDQLEKWEQVMNNRKKIACFTNIGDRAITSIIWRIAKNELTKYFAQEAHLGINKLSLQATILKTKHLVEKLSKQPRVNNITHYRMPHPMKIDHIGK